MRLGPLEFTFCHFILPSKRTMSLNNDLYIFSPHPFLWNRQGPTA
ncbi:hypothetical protein LT85_0391 [Collimonas arenae]|uniref:Uncharacterized protein n=1 Tax=Collimonas arenae TaxID=279058 RepID=A0A0A1F4R4_9BURK|nr:hypothetical protein LT85_0391 [Collimonas arenae]